jgi:uncharacterized protein YfdQ (DUF2303 family)
MSVNDDALKQIFALGRSAAPVLELKGDRQGVMVPEGYVVATFEEPFKLAPHISGYPRFTKLDSFVSYVNEFRSEATQIFAIVDAAIIRAVIDYHQKDKPGYVTHIAEFKLPLSDEWEAWQSINDKMMDQVSFAEFIEENRLNIVDPVGADLLEMVSNLQSKTTVEFQSNIKLANGTARLAYSENQETKGNGSFEVPNKLILGLPVFRYEDNYKLEAFLRTRIKDGKALFVIKLDRPKKVFLAAFEDICGKVESITTVKVLHGNM